MMKSLKSTNHSDNSDPNMGEVEARHDMSASNRVT